MSNEPVPDIAGLPMTMRAAGLVRSSKSPAKVLSTKKAVDVSKDALRRTELFEEIPVLLNAL